jgi:hypothetical protein
MAKIQFDSKGNPTYAIGTGSKVGMLLQSTGAGSLASEPKVEPKHEDDAITADKYEVAPYFADDNNGFVASIDKYLKKVPALRAAINYKIDLAFGQGVAAYYLEDIIDGKEIYKSIDIPEVFKFLRQRNIRRYYEAAYRNLYEYGFCAPQIRLNDKGNWAAAINVLDAPVVRYTQKKNGYIENAIISAKWRDGNISNPEDYDALPVLNTQDGEDIMYAHAKVLKNFVFPLDKATTGNSYYPLPPWFSSQSSGHLDISLKIAEYINAMFDNQMSIKYHIRIPYAYWEKKYPLDQYATDDLKLKRQELISKDIDAIESSLTDAKNAKKAIISHFELNPQGKPEEKWEIDVIDDKYKSDQYLPHTQASNAETFVSMGVNPMIKGMAQASGPYANSSGGSNIREAYLIDLAHTWNDRQEVHDPIEMMLRINFPKLDTNRLEVRTRSTVLTTLDTGSGSKTLS